MLGACHSAAANSPAASARQPQRRRLHLAPQAHAQVRRPRRLPVRIGRTRHARLRAHGGFVVAAWHSEQVTHVELCVHSSPCLVLTFCINSTSSLLTNFSSSLLEFLRGCVGGVLRRSARKQGIDPVLQFDPRAALGHLQFHPQIVVSAKDDAGVRDVLVGV